LVKIKKVIDNNRLLVEVKEEIDGGEKRWTPSQKFLQL
jgi:hypothetical protein